MHYKKQEVHMIDMSGRLRVQIVHEEYTEEDEKKWEKEVAEMEENLEKRMERYEAEIKALFIEARSDTNTPKDKDAGYFIREYGEKFMDRNPQNIENRLKLYNKYIEELN